MRAGEPQVTMKRHADGHRRVGGFNPFKAGLGITYGRVEFDAKVEAGQGTVAGILVWPADDTFPTEIDILETPKNTGLFTLHWANADGSHGQSSFEDNSFDPSEWHRRASRRTAAAPSFGEAPTRLRIALPPRRRQSRRGGRGQRHSRSTAAAWPPLFRSAPMPARSGPGDRAAGDPRRRRAPRPAPRGG